MISSAAIVVGRYIAKPTTPARRGYNLTLRTWCPCEERSSLVIGKEKCPHVCIGFQHDLVYVIVTEKVLNAGENLHTIGA